MNEMRKIINRLRRIDEAYDMLDYEENPSYETEPGNWTVFIESNVGDGEVNFVDISKEEALYQAKKLAKQIRDNTGDEAVVQKEETDGGVRYKIVSIYDDEDFQLVQYVWAVPQRHF